MLQQSLDNPCPEPRFQIFVPYYGKKKTDCDIFEKIGLVSKFATSWASPNLSQSVELYSFGVFITAAQSTDYLQG